MLREIASEMQAELDARACPFRIVYGPERAPISLAQCRAVIERDRGGTENVSAPKSRGPNPRMIAVRSTSAKCRVFAKSSLSGANVYDHERFADQMVDQLTVSLHACVRRRCTEYRISSARILAAEELQLLDLEAWPGVVYEFKFEVDRGVFDTTWTGERRPTVDMGGAGGVSLGTSVSIGDSTNSNDLPSAQTRIE